jgi:hypothetical protein
VTKVKKEDRTRLPLDKQNNKLSCADGLDFLSSSIEEKVSTALKTGKDHKRF